MWDRPTLKHRAKLVLSKSYWHSFLVSLVTIIVPSVVYFIVIFFFMFLAVPLSRYSYGHYSTVTFVYLLVYMAATIGFFFLTYVLFAGKNLYYINCSRGDIQFNYAFLPLTSGKFLKVGGTMLLMSIRIFLWSLLFFIPGIIKAYQYCMVPYIVAENPDISISEAIAISTAMTQGEKFNIFILNMSFMGWYIAASFLPFIGTLFLLPYIEATFVELYEALKYKMNVLYTSSPPMR